MKLALAYSTKDQVELTEQTWPRAIDGIPFDSDKHKTKILWCDASRTEDGIAYFENYRDVLEGHTFESVFGGADAAIIWKLSKALQTDCTHVMLLENDVLLDPDWLKPTMELFEKGKTDGLEVGAVSPRSYVDRVLIQRDGYAVMHNLGAGVIIFTREAAEIVLRTFRTNWWPDNVKLFAQLSGIDLRTYAAFRGNEQWTTTDWAWEAQLARHGLASLALTPARCRMVGQVPTLEQQGLELVTVPGSHDWQLDNEIAFRLYRLNLAAIRNGLRKTELPGIIHREGAGMLFFPHQLGALNAEWSGSTILKWSQGFGPFAYRAGPDGASLSVRVSGISQFLCTGGDAGARVTITDTRSGFNFAPDLPAQMEQPVSISVPGGPIPRLITFDMAEGAVFYGLQTTDPQMIDTSWKFDWAQLPPAVTNGDRA